MITKWLELISRMIFSFSVILCMEDAKSLLQMESSKVNKVLIRHGLTVDLTLASIVPRAQKSVFHYCHWTLLSIGNFTANSAFPVTFGFGNIYFHTRAMG